MSSKLVEYFVTIGLGDTLEPINSTDDTALPLTGIKASFGKPLHNMYESIEYTVSGHSANINKGSYFAADLWISVSRVAKEGPPITDIRLTSSTKYIPGGYKSVLIDCSGKSAYLCYGTHPTEPPIVDLQIYCLKNNEKVPASFMQTEGDVSSVGNQGFMLCFRRGPGSPLEMSYQAQLLDRFPLEDNPMYPLPQSVPIFCKPDGLTLRKDAEAPTAMNFVLTTGEAVKLYGCVVCFYEPVKITKELLRNSTKLLNFFRHRSSISEDEKIQQKENRGGMLSRQNSEEGDEDVDESINKWSEITKELSLDSILYTQKCICVLSYYPYFDNFRQYMAELYRISCSPDIYPIERYICNLWETPLPRTEQIRSELTIGQASIHFETPPMDDFPLVNFSFEILFKCLSVNAIIQLVTALIMERKIILTAKHSGLLAPVAEAALALIFPFQWQYSYIPVLPKQISGIVDAPMPIFIGVNATYTDNHYFSVDDICIFDLETGDVYISEKNPLPEIPSQQLKDLKSALESEAHISSIEPFTSIEKEFMDFAFHNGAAPSMIDSSKQKKEKFNSRACRAAFLNFFAEMLLDFQKYLLYPTENNVRGLDDLFDRKNFLSSRNLPITNSKKLIKEFLNTQCFMRFIEERTFSSSRSHELDFFDDCLKHVASLKKAGSRQSTRSLGSATLVQKLSNRHFERETYVVPPPKIDDLEHPFHTFENFPKLDEKLFYSPRPIEFERMKFLTADNREKMNRSFQVTFAQPKEMKTKQRAGSARGSLMLNYPSRGLIKKEQWAEILMVSIYACWFVLQAQTIDFIRDKEKHLNNTLRMLNFTRTHKLEPDELIYCNVLILAAKLRQTKTAEAIFEAMKAAGIQPSSSTYLAYTSALAEGNTASTPESGELTKILRSRPNSAASQQTPLVIAHDEELNISDIDDEDEKKVPVNQNYEDDSQGTVTMTASTSLDIDYLSIQMSGIDKCPRCGVRLPDSELMAGWSDDMNDYTTSCISCQQHRFVPTLKIRYTAVDRLSPKYEKSSFFENVISDIKTPSNTRQQFEIQHPYLNPLVLRKQLEIFVRNQKKHLSSEKTFRLKHPILFWNLLWYFAHQRIPLDCILGESFAENVRIVPLEDEVDNSTSSFGFKKMSIFQSSLTLFPIDHIHSAIKSNDISSALRMFLRNRSQSEDPLWAQGMFKYIEDIYLNSLKTPSTKIIQEFVQDYKKAFSDLPPDLLKLTNVIDKAPGTSVKAFRSVFKHEEFYISKEITYVKEIEPLDSV